MFFFNDELVGEELSVEGVEFEALGRRDGSGEEEGTEGVVVRYRVGWGWDVAGGRKGVVRDFYGEGGPQSAGRDGGRSESWRSNGFGGNGRGSGLGLVGCRRSGFGRKRDGRGSREA